MKNILFMKYCKFCCRPVSVTSNNSLKALLAKMLHLFKIVSACLIVIVCVFCVLVACVSTFVFCEYACSDIVMWRLPHTLPSRQRVKPRPSPVAWSFLHLCYFHTFIMSTFLSFLQLLHFYIFVIPTPSTCLHFCLVKKMFVTCSYNQVNTSIWIAKLSHGS